MADKVGSRLPGWRVHSATLAKPGALEAALGTAGPAPLIYPMFMTDGWFVRSALPKRLGKAPRRMLSPLGVDPRLSVLVAEVLRADLSLRGWEAATTTLLVAAHGSGRSDGPKRDTEHFARALAAHIAFRDVLTGYVEQTPWLADAARTATGQALCLPFFAARGGHVQEDVPEALAQGGFDGPCLLPVGTFQGIPDLISACAKDAMSERPDTRG